MSTTRYLTIAILGAAIPLAAHAGTFTTLYAFHGGADGANPTGPVMYQGGWLYGTAGPNVFKVKASSGHFEIVHAFSGGTDGSNPSFGVVYQGGMLYGTTAYGGGTGCVINNKVLGCGTIYSINAKTEAETILYSPQSSSLGAGSLLYLAGTLYGPTFGGGANGDGSIFSFDLAASSFTTLFSFSFADGQEPNPQLLYQNGLLYGTTLYGGAGCERNLSCGVLFSIDPLTGAESTFYEFQKKRRGAIPFSNVVYHSGSFIGATNVGGSRVCRYGCGVTFAIDAATGAEKVISVNDTNAQVASGMILLGDKIYESLPQEYGADGDGNGELVEFDLKTKVSTVLYTFTGGTGGSHPQASLIYQDGALYGTSVGFFGGGDGSVFKYVP